MGWVCFEVEIPVVVEVGDGGLELRFELRLDLRLRLDDWTRLSARVGLGDQAWSHSSLRVANRTVKSMTMSRSTKERSKQLSRAHTHRPLYSSGSKGANRSKPVS